MKLLTWGMGLALAVGLLWRVGRYLAQFPIWGDEAFILLNLLDLDYAGLAGPLQHAQVAPLLFLWSEEAALNSLGHSEIALRLPALLAGCAGLVLFWRLARHALAPLAATIAVALLALSYFPVRHACEVKPYAFDLFWSIALYWAALDFLREPQRLRGLAALVLLVPLAVWSSYPVVFAAGAVSMALLPSAWRSTWPARGLFVLYNLLLVGAFVAHYELVGRRQASPEQAQLVHDFMRDYWRDSFPPAQAWRWPIWLLDIHTGNLFAYPAGGKHGASVLSFALFLVGAVVLWRQRNAALLALCLGSFALTLLAAILGRYPYGGSARVAQHLAAPICLLMGVGAAAALARLRPQAGQERCGFAVCVLLALMGAGGLAYDWLRPYKTLHDFEVRRLAQELATQLHAGDTLLVCNDPVDVSSEMQWYLRLEKCRLTWLQRDPVPAAAAPLWLLYYDLQPASDERVLSLLPPPLAGWTTADRRATFLPAENSVSKAWYCTRLQLVPPTTAALTVGSTR